MNELIDKQALRDEVLHDDTYDNDIVNYYLNVIDAAPAVDAVPVMRCRECERYKVGVCLNNNCALYGKSPPSDYLCAYGERREGDEHE